MTKPMQKIIPAVFYRTAVGTEPVRDWNKELGSEDHRIRGTDIRTVEFGWPIGMPVCRPMGNGLFEVRSAITGKRGSALHRSRPKYCLFINFNPRRKAQLSDVRVA
jgi:hypothetical protein